MACVIIKWCITNYIAIFKPYIYAYDRLFEHLVSNSTTKIRVVVGIANVLFSEVSQLICSTKSTFRQQKNMPKNSEFRIQYDRM